ncbi:short-chain dehydrogenase [Sphingomonas spermidinifaciens]|uniref:Short-chain dehydrogenase n=1 Tax=Sphingomonas spermidinifaciens TaxID=1141889 RepID=A0A2A4B1N1_9SPHN|nr:SDR family oxidoreductase [Sphingomonas spermidinifaciens]PCD01648.1 short-chain dehydrogenase [Sphingomonas spermidinifaciens]
MSERPLALVTGSCRRLGAHIAAALGEAGYDLALHASSRAEPERWLADRLTIAGATFMALPCDLGDLAAAEHLVPRVAASFGRVPVLLVNNASRFAADEQGLPGGDALVDHFRVNAAAPVLLAKALAQMLGEGEGAVVNILDQRIAHPPADQLAYTLSKQALAEATRTLARVLAPRVRVNAVAPGLTIPTQDYGDAQLARLTATMPLRRLSQPEDVAAAVVYLAGARASTGQTLFVDGGAGLHDFARDFVHLERD